MLRRSDQRQLQTQDPSFGEVLRRDRVSRRCFPRTGVVPAHHLRICPLTRVLARHTSSDLRSHLHLVRLHGELAEFPTHCPRMKSNPARSLPSRRLANRHAHRRRMDRKPARLVLQLSSSCRGSHRARSKTRMSGWSSQRRSLGRLLWTSQCHGPSLWPSSSWRFKRPQASLPAPCTWCVTARSAAMISMR